MNNVDIYDKTENGKQEVADSAAGLSMMERRVLILVNGENEVEKLSKLSLCDDIDTTLNRLLELGLIEVEETTIIEVGAQGESEDAVATDGKQRIDEAREFMSNTLQTFGNRVRISDLNNTIVSTNDFDGLISLIKPWYHAISETPGGMYQADDLRKEVLDLLDRGAKDAA